MWFQVYREYIPYFSRTTQRGMLVLGEGSNEGSPKKMKKKKIKRWSSTEIVVGIADVRPVQRTPDNVRALPGRDSMPAYGAASHCVTLHRKPHAPNYIVDRGDAVSLAARRVIRLLRVHGTLLGTRTVARPRGGLWRGVRRLGRGRWGCVRAVRRWVQARALAAVGRVGVVPQGHGRRLGRLLVVVRRAHSRLRPLAPHRHWGRRRTQRKRLDHFLATHDLDRRRGGYDTHGRGVPGVVGERMNATVVRVGGARSVHCAGAERVRHGHTRRDEDRLSGKVGYGAAVDMGATAVGVRAMLSGEQCMLTVAFSDEPKSECCAYTEDGETTDHATDDRSNRGLALRRGRCLDVFRVVLLRYELGLRCIKVRIIPSQRICASPIWNCRILWQSDIGRKVYIR